jgi:hypothetical protein
METWSNTCWTWRHRWRLTQWKASGWANVSLTTWSRWERGLTEPSAEEARRVVKLMWEWELLDATRKAWFRAD